MLTCSIGLAAEPAKPAIAQYQIQLLPQTDVPQRARIDAQFATPIRVLRAEQGAKNEVTEILPCEGVGYRFSANKVRFTRKVSCVSYEVILKNSASSRFGPVGTGVLVSSPAQWLWLPTQASGSAIEIVLALADGVQGSVPWMPLLPRVQGERSQRYSLQPSPGSGTGLAIFGALAQHSVQIGDAHLRVSFVPQQPFLPHAQKLLTWIRTTAEDVASVYGRFPNPNLQIIVNANDSPGDSPIPFGHVMRNGGETVQFFVQPSRRLEDFVEDWTATHEFAHLLLPYINQRQKWLSEGYASYYQNILLARRGVYSQQQMWRRFLHSFVRASETRNPPTLDNLHKASFWETRMLVYWSGAALALMADVELRRRSDNKESLDTVLGRFQACCLPAAKSWQAVEFFSHLDSLTEYPVFMASYTANRSRTGLPDLAATLKQLGIRRDRAGEFVGFDDNAPLADLRLALSTAGE